MIDPTVLHHKIFRADKTTPNRDDFRVLMVGTMIAIFMMLIIPVVAQVYDTTIAGRPFVTATVEIIQTDDYQNPMLLYDADAKQPTDATWIAMIRDEKGYRLDTRRGHGSYEVEDDNPRLWTWEAFFETENGIARPPVPKKPFQVCVRYVSVARDSGVLDHTPESCSKIFYPEHANDDPVTSVGEMP